MAGAGFHSRAPIFNAVVAYHGARILHGLPQGKCSYHVVRKLTLRADCQRPQPFTLCFRELVYSTVKEVYSTLPLADPEYRYLPKKLNINIREHSVVSIRIYLYQCVGGECAHM
jgi:hypothetical protein